MRNYLHSCRHHLYWLRLYRLRLCRGVLLSAFLLSALLPAAAQSDHIVVLVDETGRKIYVNTGELQWRRLDDAQLSGGRILRSHEHTCRH